MAHRYILNSMANRYIFNSTLTGYIRIDEPNQFGCTFEYTIPEETIKEMESDREELLAWCRTKLPKADKVRELPWVNGTTVKYQYQQPDAKNPNPDVVWVDTEGSPLDKEVLRSVRDGTKVRLIVQQKPNPFGDKIGTKLIVLGAQILELNAGKIVDSGDLTVDDVQALFAATPVVGYRASAPQVRAAAPEVDNGDYDF
jgi:hypothetical protein